MMYGKNMLEILITLVGFIVIPLKITFLPFPRPLKWLELLCELVYASSTTVVLVGLKS